MRSWLYEALSSHAGVAAFVGDRIYQSSGLTTVPDTPFLVYGISTQTPAIANASRLPVRVWAHDSPGSYLRIDDLLWQVLEALEQADRPGHLLDVRWIENSQDLPDDELKTITRFTRLQLVLSQREQA